LIWRWIIR